MACYFLNILFTNFKYPIYCIYKFVTFSDDKPDPEPEEQDYESDDSSDNVCANLFD